MLRRKSVTRASSSRRKRPHVWAWVPRFRRPSKGSGTNWIRCRTIKLPSPSVRARLIKKIASPSESRKSKASHWRKRREKTGKETSIRVATTNCWSIGGLVTPRRKAKDRRALWVNQVAAASTHLRKLLKGKEGRANYHSSDQTIKLLGAATFKLKKKRHPNW